jgi:paraquat-inducible protein B
MVDPQNGPELADELPKARVYIKRWNFPVIWIVPVIAAIVAGILIYDRLREYGPTITIKFRDGSGVEPDRTQIRYRGVPIGEVTAVELSEDQEYVVVTGRLRQSAAPLARGGSVFWIVRPELGLATVSGLSTIISGPYIQVLPGTGKPKLEFIGLDSPPPALERIGLNVIVAAPQLGSVRPGSPVYYRGIEVGSVTKTELSRDATLVHIHLFIQQRYARLVRAGSRFWRVSGVDVNVSLLRGVEINIESLRSLITGGIVFATPDDPNSPPAKDGTIFLLHEKPREEWLEWAPRIPIPPAN